MNLSRDVALAAMDALTSAGCSAHVEAVVIPADRRVRGASVLYRVSVPALSFDDVDLRALCDLAEGIGLECRYSLQAIRFEPRGDERRHRQRLGAA